MNELFADYIPGAWFEKGAMRKSGLLGGLSTTAAKRMRRLKHTVRGVSVSLALSFAVGSVALAATSGGTNGADLPLPPGVEQFVPPPPAQDASVGQVNESFDALFAAFRSGTKLITNDRTRGLANKAAARRGKQPDGWAKKLASDTGHAND